MSDRNEFYLVPVDRDNIRPAELQPLERSIDRVRALAQFELLCGRSVRQRRDLLIPEEQLQPLENKIKGLLEKAARSVYELSTRPNYNLEPQVRLQNEVLRLLLEIGDEVDVNTAVQNIQRNLRQVYAAKFGASGGYDHAKYQLPNLEGIIPVRDYIVQARREAERQGVELEFYINEGADIKYAIDLIQLNRRAEAGGAQGEVELCLVQIKKNIVGDVAEIFQKHEDFLIDFELACRQVAQQGLEAVDVPLSTKLELEVYKVRDRFDTPYLSYLEGDIDLEKFENQLSAVMMGVKEELSSGQWGTLSKSEQVAFALRCLLPIASDIYNKNVTFAEAQREGLQKIINNVIVDVNKINPGAKYRPLSIQSVRSVIWSPDGKKELTLRSGARKEVA